MQQPQTAAQSKTLAVVALVLGICGLIPLFGLLFCLVAVILSLIVLFGRKPGTGMAVGGLVCACVAVLLNIVFLAAIIIPAVAAARRQAVKAQQAQLARQAQIEAELARQAQQQAAPPPHVTPRTPTPPREPVTHTRPATNAVQRTALQPASVVHSNSVAAAVPPAAVTPKERPQVRPSHGETMPVLPKEEIDGLIADLKTDEMRRLVPATMKLMRTRPESPNPAMAAALSTLLLENKNVPIQVNAARALEVWGTQDSLSALKKAAESPSRVLQSRAQIAIEAITSRKAGSS